MSTTATRHVPHVDPADDPLCPYPARVQAVTAETPGIATFDLQFTDNDLRRSYRVLPGQFNMIYLPGVGEVPISVSTHTENGIGHTIRYVGRVTRLFESLSAGDVVGLRGPYGKPWPMDRARGQDVLIVAGGLGLAPLRLAVEELLANRQQFGRLILLYGSRQPADLLYSNLYSEWQKRGLEMIVTVDRADATWTGNVGVVPVLVHKLTLDPERTLVMTCGPEIMMRFAAIESSASAIADERIYVSLERNMHCALGLCGHCQLGPEFVCKDGPVFSYRDVRHFFLQEHF